MKPAPFDYLRPATLTEALEALSSHGDDAKLLAGGQSLMPLLNMRLATPRVIVDINGLSELDYIRLEGDLLCVGALTRQYKLEKDPLVRAAVPFLAPVAKLIGHPQIRHSGTVGGSLVHADPSAELPAAMCALRARFRIVRPDGDRLVEADDFFVGTLAADLRPDEMLAEVRVPVLSKSVWGIREYARRAGDFALAGAAVVIELAGAGRCRQASVVLFGVGDRPIRAAAAESYLTGRELSGEIAGEFAAACVEGLECDGDIHVTGAYRKHLAAVMAKRALLDAVRSAKARNRGLEA